MTPTRRTRYGNPVRGRQLKASTVIDRLLRTATDAAMQEVEALARRALDRNPRLSFCLGMGTACFYLDGRPMDYNERAYFRPLYDFLDEFDRHLYLTGIPLKLVRRPDGSLQRLTDW